MNLFSYAFADMPDSAAAASPLMSLVPLLVIFAIFYLFVIRPQSKKVKAHSEMLNSIKIGDKVLTAGGIIGLVVKVDEKNSLVHLEIFDGAVVKIAKNFITERILKRND